MPSQTFQLARTEALESLPDYTPLTQDASHRRLSTILEMDEDDAEAGLDKPRFWTSWELRTLMVAEYATMIPQALLVDASSTLCVYLFFTSLQARLALEHKASLDLLSSICAAMPDDADASVLANCTAAISQYRSGILLDFSYSSHHYAMGLVLLKAILGFALLRNGSRYIKPFDYLVASGAAHCLSLYGLFFVPVANLLDGEAITGSAIWVRVVNKFFWLLAFCALFTLVHWSARAAFKPKRAIELPVILGDAANEKVGTETA